MVEETLNKILSHLGHHVEICEFSFMFLVVSQQMILLKLQAFEVTFTAITYTCKTFIVILILYAAVY